MDSGSSHSFVTTSVAKELKLKPEFYTTFRLSTFGGKLVDFESAQTPCVLSSLSGNEFKLTLKPFTSDALSNLQIPPKEIQPKQHLLNANVAIPEVYTETISPDIILGADVFFELVTGNVVRGSPLAVETRLGWTLYGHLDNTVSQPETKGHSLLTVAADDGSNLWRLESVGINGSPHERDEFPDPEFVNGKLQVRLPFLSDVRPASNFASAKKRADSLLKRLTAEQLHEYDSVFARDLERGTIEKLDECDVSEGFFLPHRAVFRPNKALRIVFNASCRSNESKRSLNDSLDQGAPMNNDLVNVLLRFRQGKYAQSCDVSKAFHCLLVHPDDRKWLRFVWKNEIWQHLKLAFGVTASPTLLAHSLRFVFAQLDDKKLAEALTNQLYVDDLLHSHDTMEELNEFREKVDKIFGVIDMQLIHNKDSRPLGIVWDRENDTLSIDVSKRELPSKLTRRNLLSYLSSFFDPLGWLQPAVLPLKLLFQKSWSLPQIGWDDTLPEEFSEQWKAWALSLPVESPSVPRWILLSKDATWELHCFSDASQSAAGVAIYSVVDGQARLLYSRSRLNPLKVSLTIPKGELVAFLLVTRAALLICSQLKKPLSCTFWTDATTVIHWLGRKGSSLRSEVFVKNRIQQIHDIFRQLPNISVRYIDTSLNPADRASRGVSFEELSASDWFTGPSFLSLPQEQWPIAPPDVSTLTPEKMGISEAQVCFVADPPAPPHPACYSSLRKLVSVTALCLGFIARLRQKVARRNGNVDNTALPLLADVGAYGSPEAKRRALFVWIRKAQEEAFSEDFDSLQQGLPLSRQSPLWSLNPTWDLQLKCIVVNPRYGGQLVLLPRRAAVTRLIVLQIHECLCHANVTATLAEARVSYWIPQGNAAVKSILHFCLPCRQKKQLPFSPPEGALASFRITPAPAFQTFGLDHVGAFQSRDGVKYWLLVFTCAKTRAVQVYPVCSLAHDETERVVRRFLATYVAPFTQVKIFSDNALGFVKLAKARFPLHVVLWRFIPPRCPENGGFYEILNKVLKRSLRAAFGHQPLKLSDVEVVVREISSIINSRPLLPTPADLHEDPVITPNHFLFGLRPPIWVSPSRDNLSLSNRFVARSLQASYFWKRWLRSYLPSLTRWHRKRASELPKIGDVVLLTEPHPDAKNRYPLARILQLFPGKDGVPRRALVSSRGKSQHRLLSHLVPLEIPSSPSGQ
jgi:hypothetical protein